MRDPNINYAREEVCHNCLSCNLDTAGQHEPDCPLFQGRVQFTTGDNREFTYPYYNDIYALPKMP